MALQRLGLRRTCLAGAGGLALVLGAGAAGGAPTAAEARACMTAYTTAQQSEEAGHLLEEKDLLLGCLKPACSRFLKRECLTRRTQLESDIPTVVPRITGEKGAAPPANLQIRMDGALLTSGLGEPVAVDPGVHEFTFSTPDGALNVSQRLMIMQGDVNRPVAVSLGRARSNQGLDRPAGTGEQPGRSAPSPAAASVLGGLGVAGLGAGANKPAGTGEQPGRSAPSPATALVLGGLGVAGLGAGAALFALGKQTTWNLAVDSLGIGAGALAGALWLFAKPRHEKSRPSPAAYTVDVHPTPSGAVASLSGIF
jgi:hypothetical protein